MNDLTFLDEELANEYGACDAILKAVLPGGKVIHISDAVSPFKFLETCPLLYHAFEYNAQSRLQASIDASSETAVISLARYCYTGSYLAVEPDGESILLLQHAETYKIAEDFDVPELQIMAHGNFSCQIEYSCCLPEPPKDLLETIRFIYRHFASDEARRKHNLVDTLLNYCVAVYLYHKLGESLEFLTAVHEISAFRQDLCRTNIARNFEDDCAADIIRLPPGPVAAPGSMPTTLASRELPDEMLYDLPRTRKHSNSPTMSNPTTAESMNKITLSYRHGQLGMHTFRQGIPDRSKHCVSPSALAAALERCGGSFADSDEVRASTAVENPLRTYKRARIEEATARLEGWPVVARADSSDQNHDNAEKSALVKVEADEDSYWAGAFRQPRTESRDAALEACTRRTLSEYDYDNAQLKKESHETSSSCLHDNAPTALPHQFDSPTRLLDTNTAVESTGEDEGYAIIHHSEGTGNSNAQSPMSSPELLPAKYTAKATAHDKTESDDEWTML